MIFILEDDDSIRGLVSYALNSSGYQTEGFETPSAFWSRLAECSPELILLDIMLPEEDGISILKRLKSDPVTAEIPVIMTTAKGSEYDKVLGLDLGADDYMAKPFGMMELISRVRVQLRRTAPRPAPPRVLCYRALSMNEAAHEVSAAGQTVTLTLKEFHLLKLLLSQQGTVLGREALLREVWGYDYDGETRTVDVHIGTLRQKLGVCGEYIETIRGVGYKLGGKQT